MMRHLSWDARSALGRAGISRRAFLKGSGALVVAFSSAPVANSLGVMFAQGFNGTGSAQLDSWVAIGRDGIVTAFTGKCDFGQGLYTAQMQLVAEEVCVPLSRVRLIQCDTSVTPDQGTTSGQQSHPTNFNHANLALAGATARQALIRMASEILGVPVSDLVARDGLVVLKTDPSRSAGYGDLIGGRRFNIQLDQSAVRKHPREWSVLGTPVPRVDMRDMVMGRFEFVHNVKVPGMLHGCVVRPPEVGATRRQRRRKLHPRAPGHRKGRRQRRLRRYRGTEAMAGHARRRAPQGELDARNSVVFHTPTCTRGFGRNQLATHCSWIPVMSMPGWRRRLRF